MTPTPPHRPPARRPRAPRLLASLALAAALAGCAGLAGTPRSGATPVAAGPATWQAPLPPGGRAPDARWWTAFDDPALPPLVQAAEAAATGVASARARLAQAAAARSAAAAQLLPAAQGSLSAQRSREMPNAAATNLVSAGLQAGWEIDLFGARRAGAQAAGGRERAAAADLAAALTAVRAETVGSLIALRACEAQAQQTERDAASRAETARLTVAVADAGLRAPADAALARAAAAQARSAALQQRATCSQLVKALVALTALDEAELRQRLAPATARVPQSPALAPATLPAELLRQRPDLVAAAQRLQATLADQQAAEADLWPQLQINGSLGRTRMSTHTLSVTGNSFSLGPLTLTVPLFDGGARRAAVDSVRAQADEARAQLGGALRQAVREVEDALVTLDASAARRADAEAAARDFDSVLRATEARQRGGLASLFELEDARRSALAAQSALIELDRERATTWVTLARALGGGWTADPSNP